MPVKTKPKKITSFSNNGVTVGGIEIAESVDGKKYGMTLKELTFAQEFIVTGNAFESVRRAYGDVSKNSLPNMSSELLHKPKIKAYLANYLKTHFTEDYVKNKLIQRTEESGRSERSQDANLFKMLDVLGLTKSQTDTASTQILNINNVLTVVNNAENGITQANTDNLDAFTIDSDTIEDLKD